MKNITCLLLILSFSTGMYAQGEKTASATDSSAILNQILETGYLLAATGKYEDAHAYFVYALRDTPTIQVCNNAGIVAVMDALNYFRPTEPEVKFHYPVELDTKSVGTRDLKDFSEIRSEKLREAIDHFDAAIHLDTGYAPAYLNKACAYALLNKMRLADTLAQTAQAAASKSGDEETATGVHILLGILHAREGDSLMAVKAFKDAVKKGSSLAEDNLNILKGLPVEKPKATLQIGDIETIDGIALNDPYNIPDPGKGVAVIKPQIRLYCNLHPGPNSVFYFNDNTASGEQTYFLLTKSGYSGQTAGKLKLGASRSEIDSTYKKPLRKIRTRTGEIWIYPSIILMLDKNGKLSRWAIFGEDHP